MMRWRTPSSSVAMVMTIMLPATSAVMTRLASRRLFSDASTVR